ncbi:MAG: tetratricopeptide repeat protein [Nitrospirota bacterium]|nr:tetratricopeptide repeat protein [Nitrospirota bacterium]
MKKLFVALLVFVGFSSHAQRDEKDMCDLGHDYLLEEQHAEAVKYLNICLDIDDTNAEAWYYRGMANKELGHIENAIEDFSKSIQFDPGFKYGSAYLERGQLYEEKGEIQKAFDSYSSCIENNNSFCYLKRGKLFEKQKEYEKAIQDYDKYIGDGDKNNPLPFFYRGYSKAQLGLNKEAIVDYTKSLDLHPDDANVLFNRGNAKSNLSDFYGAIEDFTKCLEVDTKYTNAYYGRGYCRAKTNDFEGAIQDLDVFIEKRPKEGKGYYLRGLVYITMEEKPKGCRDFSRYGELGHAAAYKLMDEHCK